MQVLVLVLVLVHGRASGSFVRALLKHQWLRHDQTRSKRKHAAIIIIRNHGRGERKQRVINLDFPKRLVAAVRARLTQDFLASSRAP